jgi:hypothetical protein
MGRGTTLVEIMVAVALIVPTVTIAAALFPMSATLRTRSGNYSRASVLIARKLEQIRSLRSDQITYGGLRGAGLIDEHDAQPYLFTGVDNLGSEMIGSAGTLQVTNAGTDLVQVTITLSWRGMRGSSQQIAATTYLANRTVKPVVVTP